ncbi:MAG: hypothetical protein EXR69_15890 [Myxococcales bacterium]|nr:hypothetical protein [Myxococcales bacterium]
MPAVPSPPRTPASPPLPKSVAAGPGALGAFLLAGCLGSEGSGAPLALPALTPRVAGAGLPPPGPAITVKRLTIAWTGEVRGEVGVCGCPTVPYGGFGRRERYLDRLREQGDPVFVLDAGDMLTKGAHGEQAPDLRLRASTVLDLSLQVGLDAWVPSLTDLTVWPGGSPRHVGWDAAIGTNVPGLPTTTVIERDGVRVGVVGITGAGAGRSLGEDGAVDRIVDAIRRSMATANPAPDVWVALSNADTGTNIRVAEGVPALALLLSTRGGDLDPPRLTKSAPILETPDRGRFVSVVRLAVGTAPGPATVVTGPTAQPWEAWDDALERLPLQSGKARAAEEVRIAAAWDQVASQAAGRTVALVRDRPLGSDLDAPGGRVAATLSEFQAASLGAASDRTTFDRTVRYVAAGACAGCHDNYLAAWAVNDHAKAWQGLVPRDGTADPECVACHSTGWGEPGGNASVDEPVMRTWHGVQCEACHGPMSAHLSEPRANPGRAVTEATCLTCHDPANSPEFDFGTYYHQLSCVSQKAHADERKTAP